MVREVIASGATRAIHVSGTENPADLFTKVLAKNKRFQLVRILVYRSTGFSVPLTWIAFVAPDAITSLTK